MTGDGGIIWEKKSGVEVAIAVSHMLSPHSGEELNVPRYSQSDSLARDSGGALSP